MNRREVLAAFLGVPFALAACRRNEAPPLPAGEIVGTSDVFGHQLRDGLRVEVAPDAWSEVPVVIVGGGVAGLTAAWRLKSAGFSNFVLIELENAPGGTSRSGSHRSISFPWGAHYIPVPMKENVALVSLLEELGVVEARSADGDIVIGEQYLCRDPEERVFYKDRWYEGLYLHAGESEDDKQQYRRFNTEVDRWVLWRDAKGRRAFTLPVSACSDDAEATALDRLSIAEWMDQRGLTSPRLRWWVDYACRDDYGMTLAQTSAWAGLFYFCSRVVAPRDTDNGLPVDTTGVYPFQEGRLSFAGAPELMELMASGTQAHQCWAKKMTSYALQRDLVETDRPLVESLGQVSQASGASLKQVMLALVKTDAFRIRGAQ
jgi:hypothetical protein